VHCLLLGLLAWKHAASRSRSCLPESVRTAQQFRESSRAAGVFQKRFFVSPRHICQTAPYLLESLALVLNTTRHFNLFPRFLEGGSRSGRLHVSMLAALTSALRRISNSLLFCREETRYRWQLRDHIPGQSSSSQRDDCNLPFFEWQDIFTPSTSN
jgi:hypothetical protein